MAIVRTPRPRRMPSRISRILAAAAYLFGAFALVIVALGPRNPFLVRHAQQSMVLHILRLGLVSAVILMWHVRGEDTAEFSVSVFTLHLGTLVLLGIPWPVELSVELLLWLALPLGGI